MKKFFAGLALVGLVTLAAPVSALAACNVSNTGAGSVNKCTITTKSVSKVTSVNAFSFTSTSFQSGNGTNTNTSVTTFNGVPVTNSFSSCTVTTSVNGVVTTKTC